MRDHLQPVPVVLIGTALLFTIIEVVIKIYHVPLHVQVYTNLGVVALFAIIAIIIGLVKMITKKRKEARTKE